MQIAQGSVLGGRYEARDLLGRGGMGEVWRCHDRVRDTDVALKLVRETVLDETTRRLFHDEVLATARLDHPGIARVYDLLTEAEGLALVLELRAGAPLSRHTALRFAELRSIASQVLEALAYAHARGVLHLDIKPDNILVERVAGALRATLVDFGIARAWRQEDADEPMMDTVLGTLAYMAPEQITQSTATMGPWTDLYALGATLYQLASGAPPFKGQPLADRAYASPPRLAATEHGLPEELADLVDLLLAPQAHDRPTHAADVLNAVEALPEADPEAIVARTERAEMPTQAATAITTTLPDVTRREAQKSQVTGPSLTTPTARLPAALPSEPAREREEPAPGAYALFGLRELAVVGRRGERAAIWEALLEARREDRVRVLRLHGPAGAGKSRLARDALERAHEVGLANVAETRWSEGAGANEGLHGLLDNALATGGARGLDLTLALRAWMSRFGGVDDRFSNEAIAFLDPRGAPQGAALGLRVTTEAIGRLAEGRAAAIWLDQAHHGVEAASALIDRLRSRGGPIAVILTEREGRETPIDVDVEVHLDALRESSTVTLIRGLLDVSDELAKEVAARSEGNPLMVTQLLADLVEDGALVRDGASYALDPRRSVDAIPTGLPALWDRRVARAGLDPRLLGAVALVRPRPAVRTVARLAERLGPALERQLRGAERAGLLQRRRGVLEWLHSDLRAHLARRIASEQKPALHAAAAEALAPLLGTEDVQAERARHLHAAGQRREACVTMAEAIVSSQQRADRAARVRRIGELRTWAEAEGLEALRARAIAELAHVYAFEGNGEAARPLIAEAVALSEGPWIVLRRAQIATVLGDEEAAGTAAQAALEGARREGLPEVELRAAGTIALASYRRREVETARALFERVVELAHQLGDAASEAKALMHLGNMDLTGSFPLFERALEAAMRSGARRTELAIRQVYADGLYLVSRRDEAMAQMEIVCAQARTLNLRQLVSIAEIQLACWALRERDTEAAARHRDASFAAGATEGSRVERCMVAALTSSVAALEGDVEAAAAALERLEEARGDYDENELREVLQVGRDVAEGALAEAYDAALAPRAHA